MEEGLINGRVFLKNTPNGNTFFQVIPFDEWPDEFFPTNCWGVVYIMSQFVRNKLIQVEIEMFGDRQKVCSVLQIKLYTSKAFNSMTTMLGSTSPYQLLLHFITFSCSQSSSEATILFRFMRAVTMGSFVWTTSL